jgi:hypothetical protein
VLTRDNLVKAIRTRQEQRLPDNQWLSIRQIDRLINAVSNNLRHDTASQIAAQRLKYFQQNRSSIDAATISKDTAMKFERAWKHVDQRLCLLSGKDFIAQISSVLQRRKGFSITTNMLMDGLTRSEIASDLVAIISELDGFCKRYSPQAK